jgi:hypothetical protein
MKKLTGQNIEFNPQYVFRNVDLIRYLSSTFFSEFSFLPVGPVSDWYIVEFIGITNSLKLIDCVPSFGVTIFVELN